MSYFDLMECCLTLCNVKNLPHSDWLGMFLAFLRCSGLFFIMTEEEETAVLVQIDIMSQIRINSTRSEEIKRGKQHVWKAPLRFCL